MISSNLILIPSILSVISSKLSVISSLVQQVFVQSPLRVFGDTAVLEPQEERGEPQPPISSVVPPKQGVMNHVGEPDPTPSSGGRFGLAMRFSVHLWQDLSQWDSETEIN